MSLVGSAIILLVLLAWLVPLIVGLVAMRGPNRTGGIVLVIIGIIWAIPSLLAIVLGSFFWSQYRSKYEPKELDPAKYCEATATIKVPYEGDATLQIMRDQQRWRLESQNGAFTSPIGRIQPYSFIVKRKDERGKEWTMSTRLSGKWLTLTQGQTEELAAGPPYTAKVIARGDSGQNASVRVELQDAGGNAATLTPEDRDNPPAFEGVDDKGKVVWTGKFSYG